MQHELHSTGRELPPALGVGTERMIADSLRELCAGRTALMGTRGEALTGLKTRVYRMAEGRIPVDQPSSFRHPSQGSR